MIYQKYISIMTKILHFLNYNKIENENGTNQVILNAIDFGLALTYALFSFYNLKKVTIFVLIMNLIILLRFITNNLKNSINIRNKYKELHLKAIGISRKLGYDIKLIIESCIIAFTLFPFCIQGVIFEENVIRAFAIIIILISFVENCLNIIIDLFEAKMDVRILK